MPGAGGGGPPGGGQRRAVSTELGMVIGTHTHGRASGRYEGDTTGMRRKQKAEPEQTLGDAQGRVGITVHAF